MAKPYTPTTEDIREDYAWYKHADGMDQDEAAAQFDRWLREHDAALIESLAETLDKDEESTVNIALGGRGYVDYWLREKARERREGVA